MRPLQRLLSRLPGRAGDPPADPVVLELFTRADCPLCDEMKRALELARRRADVPPFRVVEVDIAANAALEAEHGRSIPVLSRDGRALFKGRLDPEALGPRLRRRGEGA